MKFKFSLIKLLPWFILLTLISELTALWCAIKFGNNHKVYNIYQVVQFGFFSYILILMISMISNKGVRNLLTGLSSLFTAFAILNLAFIQGMAQFNTVNYFGGAVIISFFSGYALSELFKKAVTESPVKMPSFWLGSSILG